MSYKFRIIQIENSIKNMAKPTDFSINIFNVKLRIERDSIAGFWMWRYCKDKML